jgi:hypothetical protein
VCVRDGCGAYVDVPGCVVGWRGRGGCFDSKCVLEFASLRVWLQLVWVFVIVGKVSNFVGDCCCSWCRERVASRGVCTGLRIRVLV